MQPSNIDLFLGFCLGEDKGSIAESGGNTFKSSKYTLLKMCCRLPTREMQNRRGMSCKPSIFAIFYIRKGEVGKN